jgi:SAM-dependent methyltransferase
MTLHASFNRARNWAASIVVKLALLPSSYRYHLLLARLLAELNARQTARSIALFGNSSRDQFSDGGVYQYKEVVKREGAELKINLDLAKERLFEILLRDEVLKYLRVTGGESLLEIGCEAGQNLSVIKAAMPKMTLAGCDISTLALAMAEKEGFSVRPVDLLQLDALGVYADNQFDYVLVSHVMEHLVLRDLQCTDAVRRNVLKHIHRIARQGYVVTVAAVAQAPDSLMLSFLGHRRIALCGFAAADLGAMGVSGFLVSSNPVDESLSLVVRK